MAHLSIYYLALLKGTEFHGEMTEGQGRCKMSLEILVMPEIKEVLRGMLEIIL